MEQAKFEKLRVYQQALGFVIRNIYNVTRHFPKDELYGLTSQMRRAAVSVPVNIAEGQGRGSLAENKQFLLIARGSLQELVALVEIAWQERYLSDQDRVALRTETFSLLRQLNGLINYLKG